MNRPGLPSFLPSPHTPLVLVATDPVWIGGVKQTLRRQEGGSGQPLSLVCVDSLDEIPPPDARQFCLLQVGRHSLAATTQWLLARKFSSTQWRVAILLDRVGGNRRTDQERDTAATLLHKAGATFFLSSLWELPPVLERAIHWVGQSPGKNADPLAELPLPIAGVGWQAPPLRV